jgi:hypothetical protein
MRRFLAGSLIGAVVAAVVAGSVYSATSLLYISGTLISGHTLVATSDGFGAQDSGATGRDQHLTLTWGPGQNLSTQTLPLVSIGPAGATAISAACTIGSAQVGGTASLSLNFAASGTALVAATNKIDTTDCNAGAGTINTTQSMGITTAAIPANAYVGVVATGAGWAGPSLGSGVIQLRIQQ